MTIACAINGPRPVLRPAPLAVWARRAIDRLPARGGVLAAAIVLMATVTVRAEEHIQDWIPDALTFPEDTEVISDRVIGSTVRMFSIATGADVDALFADWQDSLETSGYPVSAGGPELLERSIEFSGPGIANAKIILAPATEDGRSLIEFDATLD
ncbi:hypothetical protein P6F26_07075 [Roseibacterium sp. SDUM158017]|uniref:hypothetical protein n=1 Tax=Roseicyclus salinarum TaxID=3036773 RepID=UPI0024152C48|nr:hypothetical protein [Roseibacterium sp. SDUM158017]MDG4648201.1 hypothetical protein [Roseibacterium sp. SDUM158017]